MFTVFNWKMDEEVNSVFLAFDLKGGEAGFQCERGSRDFVHPKLYDPEEAVGLIGGEED